MRAVSPHAVVMQYDPDEGRWGKLAFALALTLHIVVAFLYPALNHHIAKPPIRMEVQLAPLPELEEEKPEPPATPEPVKVEKPSVRQPTPDRPVQHQTEQKQMAMPVLAAETPEVSQDYVAQEVAAPPTDPLPMATSPGPAVASPPQASSTSSDGAMEVDDGALQGYGKLLYEYAKKHKNYPQIAIRRNMQGLVKVGAKLSFGKLVDVVIVESSGHKPLDEQALEMVRKAVNELPLGDALGKKIFTVIVPVEFKLET